jgi:chemotaxis protein MotB
MYDEDIKEEQGGGEPPAWMLTFADLVSLLICFFVLLYSMKSVDETIWKKISGSFAGALNYSQKFKQVNPNNDSTTESERMIESDGMEYIQSILNTKFNREGLGQYIRFTQNTETQELHVNIKGDVMFVDDTAEITENGERIISFITETIQYLNHKIEIASYVAADRQGLSMQKSMLRSLAVRDYIQRKGNRKSIKVSGFGDSYYNSMRNVLPESELRDKTVTLDFIIKSK